MQTLATNHSPEEATEELTEGQETRRKMNIPFFSFPCLLSVLHLVSVLIANLPVFV